MLCEACGEYDANVHLTHVVNGVARSIDLCEECAARGGLNVDLPLPLADMLVGVDEDEGAAHKKCSLCQMALIDFRKSSRLGCPVCYETFSSELKPLLSEMQKGTHHSGKVPVYVSTNIESGRQLAAFNKELAAAIAAENYEEAARLRDAIRLQGRGASELKDETQT
jgi:protein arginine kinase activator